MHGRLNVKLHCPSPYLLHFSTLYFLSRLPLQKDERAVPRTFTAVSVAPLAANLPTSVLGTEQLSEATISFGITVRLSTCLSICPHGTTLPPQDGFSWKLSTWTCFEILSRKFKCHSNVTATTVLYMQTDMCTVMVISGSALLRMRNVADRRCRENRNTIWVQ